jgi:hypothetical protein
VIGRGFRFDRQRLTGLGWCAWYLSYGSLLACVCFALMRLWLAMLVAAAVCFAVDLICFVLDLVGDSIHRREASD